MRYVFAYNGKENLDVLNKVGNIKNVLRSYAYTKKIDDKNFPKEKDIETFYFDSGAFTSWTKNLEVDIDKYIKCVNELHKKYKDKLIAINLDIIPGEFGRKPTKKEIEKACKKSLENYYYIKKRVKCKLMPVFHQHDDFKYLDIYLKDDCYILGISPANDLNTKQRIPWLDKVFKVVQNKKRTHGLAATGDELLQRYPFYSCDSAAWVINSSFGGIKIFNKGKLYSVRYDKKEHVVKHNINLNVVDTENHKGFTNRRITTIRNLIKLQNYITKLWKKRGISWDI
ncbi:MAG: hypothetical protein GOVbin7581_21 [Prokaryotic dsDNA virus sp.]|nr:MAG: hypothetical protein GOVbin7581_21 [Prokaryotic dsDNA virus sp.]|tara:strand:+ start:1031 stop:1882 length:852 start_codon:yes stop_codon:yes gene_type:complete